MESLEKYLNKDEKELLSLVQYHRKQYQNVKNKQGGLHPNDIEITKVLDESAELIQIIAQGRKNEEEQKRVLIPTECPECKVEQELEPIGEQKNNEGFNCNIFYCDKCKIEFTDFRPNNAKDQLKWLEDTIVALEKLKIDFTKMPPQFKEDLMQLKKEHANFKEKCIAEEIAFKELQEAQQHQNSVIVQLRNYLLVAKLSNNWSNSSMGES